MADTNMMSLENEMRLGKTEFLAMNNPFRRFVQKHGEFRIFKNFLKKENITLTGKSIIDAGCGSGYSSKLIKDEFKPSKLTAFDLMPEQITIAQKRYRNINFMTGDLTKIELPDNAADAVFVFGMLHHIPEWREAMKRIYGFLKKSGVFLVDEPRYRYTWEEFEQGIRDAGFTIRGRKNLISLMGSYFKSYLCVKD